MFASLWLSGKWMSKRRRDSKEDLGLGQFWCCRDSLGFEGRFVVREFMYIYILLLLFLLYGSFL